MKGCAIVEGNEDIICVLTCGCTIQSSRLGGRKAVHHLCKGNIYVSSEVDYAVSGVPQERL